jgi:Protein of unknown function (DUF753)
LTSLEASLKVMECEGSLGCYATIYYSEYLKVSIPNHEQKYFPIKKLEGPTETEIPGYYTKRGCITTDMVACSEENCKKCTDNNCNYGVYPLDRNKCMKCTSDDCSATKSSYCDVYLPGYNDCTTFYDEGER